MKKVLHLLSSSEYSGAENVACTIIQNIKDEYECVYSSPEGSIQEILKEKNISYLPLNKLSYFQIKKIVKQYQPDIIHAHDYKASCIASLFSKKSRIISHIHGNRETMRRKNVKSFIFKILSKRIDTIIWVSDSCLNDFVYKDVVKDKSIILYNTVDKQNIINKSQEYKTNQKHDLIYLGRIDDVKNPERLFEIIKRLSYIKSDIKVAIVGNGPLLNRIKKLTEIFDLDRNIDFYGYLSNPYPILKKSKILILTSKWEGTPMVALEAQALNKPIVSTPIDGMKKIIKHQYNGFLCDTNDDFIQNILWMLKDNNYKKIQENIKRNFININNEKEYLKMIKKIYK